MYKNNSNNENNILERINIIVVKIIFFKLNENRNIEILIHVH